MSKDFHFLFLNPWASILKVWIIFLLGSNFLFKSILMGCEPRSTVAVAADHLSSFVALQASASLALLAFARRGVRRVAQFYKIDRKYPLIFDLMNWLDLLHKHFLVVMPWDLCNSNVEWKRTRSPSVVAYIVAYNTEVDLSMVIHINTSHQIYMYL